MNLVDVDWSEILSDSTLLLSLPKLDVGSEKILNTISDWFKSMWLLENGKKNLNELSETYEKLQKANNSDYSDFLELLRSIDNQIKDITIVETKNETGGLDKKIELQHRIDS